MTWAGTVPVGKRRLIDFTYMVPNGIKLGFEAGRYMNFLKAQGLKSGVSDIVIALPVGPYHGAYMEFKRDDKSPVSDNQQEWLDLMASVGYYSGVVRGFDAAVKFTMEYLKS